MSEETLDPYAERILAAARRLLLEHGLQRTSLADIAEAAGVAPATLYRRFANRDVLLGTLMQREQIAFMAEMDAAISDIEDPVDRLVASFVTFTRALRRHELTQRLLKTDPHRVLPLLTVAGAPAIAVARQYVAARMRHTDLDLTGDPDQLAELLVRIAHSLLVTPDTVLPLDDDEQMSALARATLAPMLVGERARR